MQCFRFNYLQLLSSQHLIPCFPKQISTTAASFAAIPPISKLGTSINQVGVSGKSIIYVRSGGEFRSFNSSMTFVSGLGRTRLYNAYWRNLYFLSLSLFLFFSFFPSSRYLIQRKVSQSKLSELFMTSVARCNSPSFKRESYDIYFYIITTLVIYPLTTYASLF